MSNKIKIMVIPAKKEPYATECEAKHEEFEKVRHAKLDKKKIITTLDDSVTGISKYCFYWNSRAKGGLNAFTDGLVRITESGKLELTEVIGTVIMVAKDKNDNYMSVPDRLVNTIIQGWEQSNEQ